MIFGVALSPSINKASLAVGLHRHGAISFDAPMTQG